MDLPGAFGIKMVIEFFDDFGPIGIQGLSEGG